MEESLCSWAHIGVFGPQHEASGRAALQRGRVFSGLRMSLGAGRAHQALEFANLYPRGPFPSGRLGGGRGCGCSCPPSTLPGPCGQSGFVEVQAAATRAARPPSGPRPRGPLTQGPSTQVHCLLTHPTRTRGPRPLTRRGPALARGEPGPLIRPVRVTRDRAALMTGCPRVCLRVCAAAAAAAGSPRAPWAPPRTNQHLRIALPRLAPTAPWF